MLSVQFVEDDKNLYACVLKDGQNEYCGGVTRAGELFYEAGAPYAEMVLRALIHKCMQGQTVALYTRDIWGVDLTRFNFHAEGGRYFCEREQLKLPHDCKKD